MDNPSKTALFAVVLKKNGADVHAFLKQHHWLDPLIEPIEVDETSIGFPLVDDEPLVAGHATIAQLPNVMRIERHASVTRPSVDPHQRLRVAVEQWLDQEHLPKEDLLQCLPVKWERLGDLVLLPREVMSLPPWSAIKDHPSVKDLWLGLTNALNATSLGIQGPIADDRFRSSQVEMLLGDSVVDFLDHGLRYTFDAAAVMFSSGNVTERRRIASFNMEGETVVDAYAGVGYYTFPMLVHAKADHVHACEINPASLEGLRRGAALNGVEQRLSVHPGDNASTLPTLRGLADRCHMGLLPSSEAVWENGLLTLKPSGGVLHIHMNVEEEHIEAWCKSTVQHFQMLAEQHGLAVEITQEHLERVKWFAPRVRHVVLDLRVNPIRPVEKPSPLP